VQVEYFPDGLSLLIVQRYDRIVNGTDGQVIGGESVTRLHQEDFCQILGKLPEQKYEKPGQRYIQQVGAAIVCYSDNPVKDLAESGCAKLGPNHRCSRTQHRRTD